MIAVGLALAPPFEEPWSRALYWCLLLLLPWPRLGLWSLLLISAGALAETIADRAAGVAECAAWIGAVLAYTAVEMRRRWPASPRFPFPVPILAALAWWQEAGSAVLSSLGPAAIPVGLLTLSALLIAGWGLPRLRLPLWLLGIALGLALAAAGHPPRRETWILHAFALMPAWIPRRSDALPLTVFYDGVCGFCHRGVRFLLGEDPQGAALRFAPLQGTSFAAAVPEAERAGLPDSIVVRDAYGRLHTRSAAALRVGAALGGYWRPLAALGRLVPRALRDAAYDAVARRRARWAAQPEGLCPLLTAEQGARFDP